MPTTPNYSLRYPSLTDTPDGATQIGNLASDVDTAMFTATAAPAAATYTPVVGNSGGATFSVIRGYYFQWGKLVWMNAYVVVNAAGSGSSIVTLTAPVSIDRTNRQAVSLLATGAKSAVDVGHALAGTAGSGAVFDWLYCARTDGNVAQGFPYLTSTDLGNNANITVSGFYRAA